MFRKKLSILIFIFVSALSFGQTKSTNFNTASGDNLPQVNISDNGIQGVTLNYSFNGFNSSEINHNDTVFHKIEIPGFNHTQDVGKPAMPMHNDLIAVPQDAVADIDIKNIDYQTFDDYFVYPALKPEYDYVGAEESGFVIDKKLYETNKFYPQNPLRIVDTLKYRGVSMLMLQIRPVKFNPVTKKIKVIKKIKYEVNFTGGNRFINAENHSQRALTLLKNYVTNSENILSNNQSLKNTRGQAGPSKNYILLTNDSYKNAADTLAQWKRQLGYSVEVVSKSSWSSSDVLNEVHTRYNNWNPKPDFLLILGDQPDVPGQVITSNNNTFATDSYYTCMDGGSDYVPEMAKGRISVSSSTEAMDVVNKIIKYEKNPPANSSFYNSGMNCAYFQESSTSGYAERRFAQTSEDAYQYLTNSIGMNVDRVYYTGSSVNPTNWNNGSYSAGEAIPSYLQKPNFAWDGDYNDIKSGINNGSLYVLHRDHGYESGWGDPAFDISNVNNLSNGDLLPIVFSINCLTGKFLESECFSESFLRKSSGGAVGVFGHAEVSYSGYNDGLALGLIDAIWANPGLVPNFTGSGHTTGNITSHPSIYEMGNVANQGLIRMTETWGDGWGGEDYTHELFHYFGDPAMKIWTSSPTAITATHDTSVHCNNNSFSINSSSCQDALATLVVDDEIVASTQLTGGTGTLNFSSISGNVAYLTISKHNYEPYVAEISIIGGCPDADFTINAIKDCGQNNMFEFTDTSTGNINSYTWNFDAGAVPSSATGTGPHQVHYDTYGSKEVELVVDGPMGSDTARKSIIVEEYCPYLMPQSGNNTITKCTGALYDMGGQGNYPTNTTSVTTISPGGASQITLDFVNFDIEEGSGSTCDYDYLEIYDGASTSDSLLGKYCNTTGSPGTITSSGGSITVKLYSDQYVTKPGFKAIFNCTYPNQPPITEFSTPDTVTCTGEVNFSDESLNGPDSWHWEFGDGDTSNNQNPTHQYTSSGLYSVKLVTSNSNGNDSLTKTDYIQVNMPQAPVVSDVHSCTDTAVTLNASGTGIINWYDDAAGTNLLDTGHNYTTQYLTSSQTYFVEQQINQTSQYFSNTNNTSDGGFLQYDHYLVFDCYEPVILKSVEVNASGAGVRTIELRNSSGTVIESKDINIPSGISRIDLNFNIPQQNDLRLACAGTPNLFRSDANTNYPYVLPGYLEIKHSSASSAPTGYYYWFYDWEVQPMPCKSAKVEANAYIHNTTANITPSSNIDACNGDSVQLTADMADNYLWYPNGETTQSIYASQPDTYYVEVFDSICSDTSQHITVNFHPQPDITINSNSPLCEGEDLNISENAGDANSWNWTGPSGFNSSSSSPVINNANIADAGTYYISVDANGCTNNDSISIIVNETPDINAQSNSPICKGDSIILTETEGDASGLVWTGPDGFIDSAQNSSLLALPSVSGYYSITGFGANGCQNEDSTEVLIDPLPVADFSYTNNDPTIDFNNLSQYANSYSWYFGDSAVSTMADPIHTYQNDGSYDVSLVVSNNCGTDSTTKIIQIINTNLENNSLDESIYIYPNPAKENVIFSYNSENTLEKVKLIDAYGRVLEDQDINRKIVDEQKLNISKHSSGVYYIVFKTENKEIRRKLIIKQ